MNRSATMILAWPFMHRYLQIFCRTQFHRGRCYPVIGVNCRFGRSCSTAGSEPSQPFPAFPEIGVFLVGKHTNQNDRPTHREIKRQRNAEQVDEVLKHLQQNHPKHDADDRAFATAERKAARTAAAMA